MLIRLGGTFARLSSFIQGTERELLPVIEKSGGTIDRVNRELDKLDVVTDSAVSMAESADTAVRAVSTAITTPVKKVSGFSAAISHGLAAFRARRDARRGDERREGGRPAEGGRARRGAAAAEVDGRPRRAARSAGRLTSRRRAPGGERRKPESRS